MTLIGEQQQWVCELCGEYELLPVWVSRRALDTVLFQHRRDCVRDDVADRDEAEKDDQR